MAKVGKQSMTFNNVYIHECGIIVGPKEYEGPLKQYFDDHIDDLHFGENSWEKAEMKLYNRALKICLNKNNKKFKDIDIVISGDLNNQIIIGNYVMRDIDIAYLGIFSACASSTEGIIIASNLIQAQNCSCAVVCISSHNSTAERQFRYPTEYGGQKPDSITSTVTAAIAIMVSNSYSKIKVTKATIGRVFDAKINDTLDMGRAMAPAAYMTINQHFIDFNVKSSDYDLILTGDLSTYGKDMLIKIFEEYNIDISANYNDCGLMIYDTDKQEVFSGGSGCGCMGAVAFSYILEKMNKGELKKVLLVATGALLNPLIVAQKETIPSIAHAIVLESVDV